MAGIGADGVVHTDVMVALAVLRACYGGVKGLGARGWRFFSMDGRAHSGAPPRTGWRAVGSEGDFLVGAGDEAALGGLGQEGAEQVAGLGEDAAVDAVAEEVEDMDEVAGAVAAVHDATLEEDGPSG